jgi:hypothetical protein
MLKNAPFEELPQQYMPIPRLGHRPPRLSFGFAIPDEYEAFVQVAVREKLGRRKALMALRSFRTVGKLVIDHLNKLCGLPPGKGLAYDGIHMKGTGLVLELETNYKQRVPKCRTADVCRVIKEHFRLPDDAKPKWYLENDIDLRDPDEFLYPGERLVTALHISGAKDLKILSPQCTFLNGPSVIITGLVHYSPLQNYRPLSEKVERDSFVYTGDYP